MEHLDSLAGSVAYKYVLGASVNNLRSMSDAGFYIVTASIDRYTSPPPHSSPLVLNLALRRLDMLSPLTPQNVTDLRLSGQVISVGSSSMEIAVKMESIGSSSGVDKTLLIGMCPSPIFPVRKLNDYVRRPILDGMPRCEDAQGS